MLTQKNRFLVIAEVNPPTLPDLSHHRLEGSWEQVLITDNVFGTIRVSPYAYAARITHDSPLVHPTVVVSTRDRNILAIESEVRGALGNGVDSFLVVPGDTYPHVDHLSHHYEIVRHLRNLQTAMPTFEVGMPTRFQSWQLRRRIELGSQFFVAGPVLDPESVEECVARLELRDDDPPVYLSLIPPFSPQVVERAERFGSVAAGGGLKATLGGLPPEQRRAFGWEMAHRITERALLAGCAGVVLMGLKFDTLVSEGPQAWSSMSETIERLQREA